MRDWLQKAFTRKIVVEDRRGKTRTRLEPPSTRLILGVEFAIISLVSLSSLEAIHMVVVKTFSSEIFAAISLVIGTILGAFFGTKA
jgi:hypothetical protein